MAKLGYGDVNFWLEEVRASLKRRDKELIQRNHYPELIKYYEGRIGEPDEKYGRSRGRLAVLNEYFPNTNQLISEIMYQNPEVMVEPRKPQAEEKAPLMKAALQYAWEELDAISEFRLGLFDMLYAGFCAIEINHINIVPGMKQLRDQAPQGVVDKVKNFFSKSNDTDSAEENEAKTGATPEENYSTQDETYLKRWNPLDVILDYRADRIKDMRFVGKILRMTVAEFDERYPAFKGKVQASDDVTYSTQKSEADRKQVILYELQVKKKYGKYFNIIIAPSYPYGEIDYFERPYETDGFNLKIGKLHEYGQLYNISVGQVNKALQDDITNYVTFMMEVAEKNVPKRLVTKNAIKPDALSKLNNSTVNECVEVDNPNTIVQLSPTNVSAENKELMAMFANHKDKLWSVSQARLTGASDAKFATELEIQEAGFQSRQLDIQNGLRNVIRETLDTLKDIIVTYWDGEYFFKVTGGDKPDWYASQSVNGLVLNPLAGELTGDFNVDVDISSALRPNYERKKKETIEYLTWLTGPQVSAILAANQLQVNPEEIRKTAKQFGLSPETIIVNVQPPPMPMGGQGMGAELPPVAPEGVPDLTPQTQTI